MKKRENLNSENINNLYPVLAIETSSVLCGACVYLGRDKFFQSFINYKNIHAERLFEIIDSVLKAAGLKPGDINAVAVSSGPGSFTGLRIGMSAAKGIAFGLSTPVIKVPTFEALALEISDYLPENTFFTIANRVNSEEVYYARFQIKSNSYIFVENLKILKFNEFSSNSETGIVFGNATKMKNSSILYRGNIFAPQPRYVAQWAVDFGKDIISKDFDYLEPNYLKNFTIKVRKNV